MGIKVERPIPSRVGWFVGPVEPGPVYFMGIANHWTPGDRLLFRINGRWRWDRRPGSVDYSPAGIIAADERRHALRRT